MYVNSLTFLMTVSKHILYRTTFYIPSREIPDILTGLDKIMHLYKKARFQVTTLYGDKEFKLLKDLVYDEYKAALNCSCAQEHILEAKIITKLLRNAHVLPIM